MRPHFLSFHILQIRDNKGQQGWINSSKFNWFISGRSTIWLQVGLTEMHFPLYWTMALGKIHSSEFGSEELLEEAAKR